MDVYKRFTKGVISIMRRSVAEAGGAEVFWLGITNEKGIVTSVKVGARGNENSVLVNSSLVREDGAEVSKDPRGRVLIHNHPSGVLRPSTADMAVAESAADTALGFYIVNNDISDVYAVIEPITPKTLEKLEESEVKHFLCADGPLAQINPHYEERKSQIELLCAITKVFNESKVGIFEAGTGVGKSYAYLIPALLWAVKNKERVVVSTGTINLQQQLIEKDIPAAQEIIGKKVKAVLLKGRQNYLCLRRLSNAQKDRDFFDEDLDTLDSISSWAETTPTGSRSDLTFQPPEQLWSRINSESDGCLGMRCPHREQCFVMKVRKDAADASLIVVNHHLLFADIESRINGVGYEDTAVLPPYRRLILDEAHGIEDSATSFFSESITRFKIAKQLNLLYRPLRTAITGSLVRLSVVIKEEDFIAKVSDATETLRNKSLELDALALDALGENYTARIHSSTASAYSALINSLQDFATALGSFTNMVREHIENIPEEDRDIPALFESTIALKRLDDIVLLCRRFAEWNEREESVFWLQKSHIPAKKKGEGPTIFAQFSETPLDIAPRINEGVFEPIETVVCASATLRTGTSFGYWSRRTGAAFVEKERIEEGVFASPFPYAKNAIFAVTRDAPFPDEERFMAYTEDALARLIEASGGRTLALFTSYETLRRAHASVSLRLSSMGIDIYRQGDDDRFRLLSRFKENKTSVLFATTSFWEGVDVPGDSLSQVIMVKLPFAVPNDPVFAARSEAVEKRGGSSFMELSVPQAVIQFRQGFGRLIRSAADKGVIVVLDKRIVEKRYGKLFTESVPLTRRMYNPLCDIERAVRTFLS